MIRGFIVGSLALIAIYVVVQQGNVDRVAAAGGVSLSLLQKLLDPGVAAIPQAGGASPPAGALGKSATRAAAQSGTQFGALGGLGIAGGAGVVS